MKLNIKVPQKDSWKVDPGKVALVVIDMQRVFLDEGAPVECPGGREIVPKINELARTCRSLKIPVIQIHSSFRPDRSDMGLIPDFRTAEVNGEYRNITGRKGDEFYPALEIAEHDYIVNKIRFSAFISGASHLELLLRGLGRDSFIACGVATEICVAASVIDAQMLGFKVFCIGDLTAGRNEALARMMLELLDRYYAKVVTFKEIMKELEQMIPESGAR